MTQNHPYQRYYLKVKPALKSKREEFRMLGLHAVTEADIWSYLTDKTWKRPQETIRIHEIVADILALSSSQFMTFQMIAAYKAPSLFEPLSSEELKDLLRD
ncbi:post-transcriptional regulator [Peribacillus asahii]|uniref:post-transcriptional regulator n=1 Tax=Peribacillus asahii TaxID=228899 RepID=UPI0037F7DA27